SEHKANRATRTTASVTTKFYRKSGDFSHSHKLNLKMNPNDLAETTIGAAYEVANILGPGFLEKVYERALLKELTLRGLNARTQVHFSVTYKCHCVGDYLADLVIENQLIVEIKCVDHLVNEHL